MPIFSNFNTRINYFNVDFHSSKLFGFDVNEILSYLVFARIIYPSSKFAVKPLDLKSLNTVS